MNMTKLAGWMVMAIMISNVSLQTANIALAKPAKEAAQTQALEIVNINKASSEELQKVRGIGPSLAERIITYREANDGFKSMDELKEVRGVGDLKFEKIKSQVTM